MAVAVGYNQTEIILRPENTPFDIPPFVPRTPYPHAGNSIQEQDTVVILRAHPGNVANPLSDDFSEQIFRHLDECWNDGNRAPDLMKLLVAQYVVQSHSSRVSTDSCSSQTCNGFVRNTSTWNEDFRTSPMVHSARHTDSRGILQWLNHSDAKDRGVTRRPSTGT
jgi:hypothetical protein